MLCNLPYALNRRATFFFLSNKKPHLWFYFHKTMFLLLTPFTFTCHSTVSNFYQITCHSHFSMYLSLFPVHLYLYLYLYLSPPLFLYTHLFHLSLIPVPRARMTSKSERREYFIFVVKTQKIMDMSSYLFCTLSLFSYGWRQSFFSIRLLYLFTYLRLVYLNPLTYKTNYSTSELSKTI